MKTMTESKKLVLVILFLAISGTVFISGCMQQPEQGYETGEGNRTAEGSENVPIYSGAYYIGEQTVLGVQGAAYIISGHSADVYSYYLNEMPKLEWTEVSRSDGIIYFEKDGYGAAVKATESIGTETSLIVAYAPEADFEFPRKASVLLPTNYQTEFPAPTDIFLAFFTDLPPADVLSQSHATVMGITGKNFEKSDQESYYNTLTEFFHDAGLKYSGSFISTFDVETDTYEKHSELHDATCVDIQGKTIVFEWESRPWQCTNNPVWREFLLDMGERSVDCGADGIHIDEWLGTYSAAKEADGCFCEYCMQGFREYLKEKYSTEELNALGIDNIDSFDYGEFLREGKAQQTKADLLASYFLDFQMESIKGFMRELITKTKAYGEEHGKTISVSANVPELMPDWLPIAEEADYMLSEYLYEYPPKGRSIPIFKLARSLGKPLVVEPQSSNPDLLERDDVATLMKIYTAEAYSSRGFLLVPYDLPAKSSKGWKFYNADLSELAPYYAFIQENNQYYEGLSSNSKIAVIYLYPSDTDGFYKVANSLLKLHFQYDALFAGDDKWMEDNLTLDQMNEYDVLVLPYADSLSGQQAGLLLSYVEQGGKVFAFSTGGPIGKIQQIFDKKGESENQLSSLLVDGSHDFGLGKVVYNSNMPSEEQLGGTLSDLIQPDIQTNANENVAMVEYWNSETHSIVIHLINYNYDIETKSLSSQKGIEMEVALNQELAGKDLTVSYDSPDSTDIGQLEHTLSDGKVAFSIPNLDYYGVVSISA